MLKKEICFTICLTLSNFGIQRPIVMYLKKGEHRIFLFYLGILLFVKGEVFVNFQYLRKMSIYIYLDDK